MFKKLFAAALALLLPSIAIAQPTPPPSPWRQSGMVITTDGTCVDIPSTVTGGCKGPGTLNASGIYVNGVAITGFGAEPRNSVLAGPGSGGPAVPTFRSLTNADLASPTITINTTPCTLGSSCTISAMATSVAVGSTTVSGSADTRILRVNGSTLGDYTISGTGTVVAMATGPTISSPVFSGTATFPDSTTWSSSGLSNSIFTFTAPLTNGIDSALVDIIDKNGVFGGGPDVRFKALTATQAVATATGNSSGTTTLIITGISGTLQPGDGIQSSDNSIPFGAVKIVSGPGGNGTYITNIATTTSSTITARRSSGVTPLAVIFNGGFCDNTAGNPIGDFDINTYGGPTGALQHGVSLNGCQGMFGPVISADLDLGQLTNLWKVVYSNGVNVANGVVVLDGTNGVGTTQKVWAFETTAVPAGGAVGKGIFLSSALNGSGHPMGLYFGSGPAGGLDAAQGSIYMRSDGAPSVNTNGVTSWDEVALLATASTLTNKTMSGSSNTFTNIGNASLTNSATTVNGQTCTLGSTCTITASATSITSGSTTATGFTNGHLVGVAAGTTTDTNVGTGVLTALGVNIGSAGAVVTFNGAGGTPSSLVGTNITGTASGLTAGTASAVAVGGITGLGTGVGTALTVNIGSAGAPVLFNGAGGTPSSMTATNLTGTAAGLTAGNASAVAVGGITGLGTGVATALATNVGSAGAFVTNGGALGTPSSGVGTNITNVNAATLGGATFAAPGSIGSGTPGSGAFTTLTTSSTATITSASASALAVGRLGATTPAFSVDASAVSQSAGLNVAGAATGGTVTINAIDSGSSTLLEINAKGTGVIRLGNTSTGNITLLRTTTVAGDINVTSAGSNSFAVGPTGTTNPAFSVDSSVGSLVAGIKISGGVTGGPVTLNVTDSGAASNLRIDAKGTGTITLGNTSTGGITLGRATTITTGNLTVSSGNLTMSSGSANFATGNVSLNSASGVFQLNSGNVVLSNGGGTVGNLKIGPLTDPPSGSSPSIISFAGNTGSATNGPLATITGALGGSGVSTGGELRLQGGLTSAATGIGGAVTIYTAASGASTTPVLALSINSAGLMQFAGITSSFPALKRSTTVLQARLADDSNFAQIQGLLTTSGNAVTGLTPGVLAASTTASIVIFDATGTAYRVPAITP